MTQIEFSSLAKEYIETYHPEFLAAIRYQENDSFDCFIWSSRSLLQLWIATYDKEITVGFEDHTGECDWHMHMSSLGANTPVEEFAAMSQLLNLILTDEEPIVLRSNSGYSLTDDVDWELQNKNSDEIATVFKWSQL